MNYQDNPPPLAKLAAFLLLAAFAVPSAAQVPTLSIGFSSSGAPSGTALEEVSRGCAFDQEQGIHLRASTGGGTLVTVNLMAHHLSGPTRLRSLNVPAYRVDDPNAIGTNDDGIRTTSQFTHRLSTRWTQVGWNETICWGNDRISQEPGVIRVLLMPGVGYRVDPGRRWIDITIADMDNCAMPGDRTENGGVVYQFNGSGGAWGVCTCAAESRHPSVRQALNRPATVTTPGPDRRLGTDDDGTASVPPPSTGFLSNLAKQFHDPSHLYCDESPYRGLTN